MYTLLSRAVLIRRVQYDPTARMNVVENKIYKQLTGATRDAERKRGQPQKLVDTHTRDKGRDRYFFFN